MSRRTTIGAALVGLTLMGAASKERATPPPLLAVPTIPRPPKIDGRILEGEWWYAAKTTGFIGLADGIAAEPQTTVYIGHDSQRLYLAFECPLASERSPNVSETGRDGRVWADDSFELLLLPPGREPQQFYHFIGNSAGAFYDAHARNKKWNGQWEYEADSGMGWWRGELSIPIGDLGADDLAGQTWRANFCRNVGKYTAWADTGRGYINPPRFGVLRFLGGSIVPRIDGIDGLRTGRVQVSGRVRNAKVDGTQTMIGLRRTAESVYPPASWPILGEKAWRPVWRSTMALNQQKEFLVSAAARTEERALLHIAIRHLDGEQVYRQTIPFKPTGLRYVALIADPSEQRLFVRTDLRGVAAARRVDLAMEFQHEGGDWQRRLSCTGMAVGRVHTTEQNLRGWPMGKYRVRLRLTPEGKKEALHEGALAYERTPPPEWFTEGSKIGVARRVLKPWTPVQWDGERLKVWGRDHDFAGHLLPVQVVSAGQAILSAPVALHAICDDRQVQAELTNRETIENAADRVVTKAHGRLGSLPIQLLTTAEYDGMLRFDLRVQPRRAVKIDQMWLSVPVRSERALYYHQATSYYGRGASASVPAEGLRTFFRPFVWLGDNERGLMWFAQSTAGWHSDQKPILIKPGPRGTELRVEFVNRVATFDKPRTIVFGLQATPVKPVPPDWRAWRTERIYTPRLAKKHGTDWKALGVHLQWRHLWWTDGYKRIFTPGHTTPLQIMPALGNYVKKCHDRGDRIITYFYLHGVNRIATGYDRYYPVWQTSTPKEMSYWGRIIMGACPGSTMGDMLLYGIRDMVTKYGIDGVYFDGAAPPVRCANELHGHGWIDDNGVRRPAYPIFALRRFYKRLATMLEEHVARPVIWIHADGKMPTPCVSFTTANWEGEMVQGQLKRGNVVLSDLLDLDFWRSHMMATQWGVVPMWLPSKFGTPEQKERQARDTVALLLVHGTPVGKTAAFGREPVTSVWKAQARFGIEKATFHGYWENAEKLRITPTQERVVASFYERDQRRMVALANFTTELQQVRLRFTDAMDIVSARDSISGEIVPIDGGAIVVDVEAKAFRLMEAELGR